MQINMSELFSAEGMEKEYQIPLEMNEFSWTSGTYPIFDAKPVKLKIIHVKSGKMKIEGTIDLKMEIPCDRCLEPTEYAFCFDFEKEVDTNLPEEERQEALDEQPFVTGYNLDVDRMIYDELVVNMPMKVLCKADCKGVCPRCGANLNEGDCGCDRTVPDPRMAAIQDIFNQSIHGKTENQRFR